ncbi:hypothetical protein D3C72_1836690 [compost metagenome]
MNALLFPAGQLMPFTIGQVRNADLLHRLPGNAIIYRAESCPAAGVNQTPEQHHVFHRNGKGAGPGLFEESHGFGSLAPFH